MALHSLEIRGYPHAQVVAAEARSKELQEELTSTYKEKSRLAEELVQASRQLQIVRDSNEAQVCHCCPASHQPLNCKRPSLDDCCDLLDSSRAAGASLGHQLCLTDGPPRLLMLCVSAAVRHTSCKSFAIATSAWAGPARHPIAVKHLG